MKRIFCLLLCLLLCCQVFAARKSGLEQEMRTFMAENGLNETNFAISYYNIKSSESFSFNADAFFSVGRVWTLPLHMYYYEQEAEGAYLPSFDEPEEFTIGGMTLEDCRYHSIILGEDTVSKKMRDALGSIVQYQELINTHYGYIPQEMLPQSYWEGSTLSAQFLMNCLQTLANRPEKFGNMMANFHLAQKADAFAGNNSPYNIVQIRGEEDGMICAVAEVTAQQPFLIAAFVSEEAGGDQVLADLNDMLCSYLENLEGVEPTVAPTTQRSSINYYVGEKDTSQQDMLTRWFVIAFGTAAVIAVITGLLVWLRKKMKKHHHR